MANSFYNRAARRILEGVLVLSSSTLKAMLVDSGYAFNNDDDFVGSGAGTPGGEELTGTGYTPGFGGAGRKTLANKVFSEDDANNRGEMDCDDILWAAINAGTAAALIVIKEGTSDADSELIAFFDSGFPKVTNGGDLTAVVDAQGLLHGSTV